MESIWIKHAQFPTFHPLEADVKTDVLVVGGGLTGILCAYMLKQAGIDCVVAEAARVCGGVTGNTTAKITVQHGMIYDRIIRRWGMEMAEMYLKAQQTALKQYDELCRHIDCDYTLQDAFAYTTDDKRALEREASAYERLGLAHTFCHEVALPIKTQGALQIANQAQFHPLKFGFALTDDLTIYENTKVLRLCKGGAVTNRGRIFAENILVTTHFPFINTHGLYFMKMYQHRSYVLALNHARVPHGMYVDIAMKGLSFRECSNTLLLGGGSHRTGKTGGNWKELQTFAQKHYPQNREVARWATQDCMTLDGIPYIGQYGAKMPHVYVATGFNKWGMTSAMAAARILRDRVCGKENEYAKVFSPSRSMWHPQLAVNMTETAVNMLRPTAPRCPHMGCALKYNSAEHSWDCPCHGSRFTKEGNVIENPATDDKPM